MASEELKRDLENAKKSVHDAKQDLSWAEKRLASVQRQHDCAHVSTDERGVFGTTCNDCGYFFNDGAFG